MDNNNNRNNEVELSSTDLTSISKIEEQTSTDEEQTLDIEVIGIDEE